MRIARIETILAFGGLRNYVFVLVTTACGRTGVGEASLEWQERAVATLIEDWVAPRVLGTDVRDLEATIDQLIRDQYQGGATVLTAISGVAIALWDLLGQAEGLPLWRLLGGRQREVLPSYINGWYGGDGTPAQVAAAARAAVARGARGLKIDPFGTAWQTLDAGGLDAADAIIAALRVAVGDGVAIMVEGHGRLDEKHAIAAGRRLARHRPAWFEEPVPPLRLQACARVRQQVGIPITTGERLYTLEEFEHLVALGGADIINCDIAHCGGPHVVQRIATLAQAAGVRLAPHCSVGPVALAAAVHVGWATPAVLVQEDFSLFDVPWRDALVGGTTFAIPGGFRLPEAPGLGLALDRAECARHPFRAQSFPSLWDARWVTSFTPTSRAADSSATAPVVTAR